MRHILRAAGSRGGMPLAEALTIVIGVAAGLHHAHEQRDEAGAPLGIVHRDVSPANVLVGFDGSVKLVDFGVAKAHARASETRVGIVKGKLCYMSPEQCQRLQVDRRSDVFALGILLYELTTNTRLYRAKTEFDLITRVATADVPPPGTRRLGYPDGLAEIVMKALSASPDRRYATTAELAQALRAFAAAEELPLSASGLADYLGELFPDEAGAAARECAPSEDDRPTVLWSVPREATKVSSPPPAPVARVPAAPATARLRTVPILVPVAEPAAAPAPATLALTAKAARRAERSRNPPRRRGLGRRADGHPAAPLTLRSPSTQARAAAVPTPWASSPG